MTDLEKMICNLARPDLTVTQLAEKVGCNRTSVYDCIERYGIVLKQRKKPVKSENTLTAKILEYSKQGIFSSAQIAEQLNCSAKHVQNVLKINNVDRLGRGAQTGELNHFYIDGRSVDNDGYVSVRAPAGHPHARKDGHMFEHRLVMENKLGRYLAPEEVVDHIDGLHLHNDPSNLRVFESNSHHLRATITGQVPNWSDAGWDKMTVPYHQRKEHPLVDSYSERKARGDVRLQQILLAMLKLGIDAPYLLGTHRHLEKAQIDYSSRSKIKHALAALSL